MAEPCWPSATGRSSYALTLLIGLFLACPLLFSPPTTAKPEMATPGKGSEGALAAPDVYKRVFPSVVSIIVSGKDGKPQKTGSGVVIDTVGHVLTNYHVVEGGHFFDVRAVGAGGKFRSFVARPVACAPGQDLAEIELSAYTGLRSVKRASGVPEVGSRVYAVGSPFQLEGTLTEGVVSQLRELDEKKLIQTTAAISSGSSGGGLFNSRGELVGITTMSLSGGQNLNFAVSLAGLRALTPCAEFPVLVDKEEASSQASASSALPDPLPCHTAAFQFENVGYTWERVPLTHKITIRSSGYIRNTGCQALRDIRYQEEVYLSHTKQAVDLCSGSTDDSEIEAGMRSFYRLNCTFEAKGDAEYSTRPSSILFKFVDPKTGALIPKAIEFTENEAPYK